MSRSRLVYIVLLFTAILVGTVDMRISSSRAFFRWRRALVEQDNLKRQLMRKELQLEELLNPSVISEHVNRGERVP